MVMPSSPDVVKVCRVVVSSSVMLMVYCRIMPFLRSTLGGDQERWRVVGLMVWDETS